MHNLGKEGKVYPSWVQDTWWEEKEKQAIDQVAQQNNVAIVRK